MPAAASAAAPVLSDVPVLLLVDGGSGQRLYARQEALSFVPASVTKVMTAYTAFELMRAGKLKADQHFTVSDRAFAAWHMQGTSMWLRAGEKVPVDALLRGITTVSANDGAAVLAEGAGGSIAGWASLMNDQARNLGMLDSRFATPNGWPDNGATYVSARDLVTLGQAMVTRHPDQYRRYFGQRTFTWSGVTQTNRDPLTGVVVGADGIKTGHTNEAGYNLLGSAERNGRRLFVVVAGARSEAERARAGRVLLEWGFADWVSRPLFASGAVIGTARVQDGAARNVKVAAQSPVSIAIPKDRQNQSYSLIIRYDGPLIAPIAKGQRIARLEVRGEGIPQSDVPLHAAEAVGRAGPLDRLWNGLMGLVS